MNDIRPYPPNPRYKVSAEGRVWGPSRRELRGVLLPAGYRYVMLFGEGGKKARKRVMLHRMVLETFVGPPPPGTVGCHDNGDPTDSRLSNLRWDTMSSNQVDRIRHGTHNQANKTHCPQGHEYTPENTYVHEWATPHRARGVARARHCRACGRNRDAARASQLGVSA